MSQQIKRKQSIRKVQDTQPQSDKRQASSTNVQPQLNFKMRDRRSEDKTGLSSTNAMKSESVGLKKDFERSRNYMTQSQDVDKIMMINENDFAADQNGDKIVQDMQSKTVGQKQQMQEQNLIDIDQLQNELDEMQAYTDAKNFESQKPLIHNNHNSRNLFEKHANS